MYYELSYYHYAYLARYYSKHAHDDHAVDASRLVLVVIFTDRYVQDFKINLNLTH
mgnify:CR=1